MVRDTPEAEVSEPKDLTNSLKRSLDSRIEQEIRKPKKSVRWESSVQVAYLPVMIPNPFSLNGQLHPDFCDFLRRCSSQKLKPDVCIATLESSRCCKNFVFPYPFQPPGRSERGTSLRELVSCNPSQTPIARSPLVERLRLARLLTEAILRYHTTPWISQGWGSEDIVFFPKIGPGGLSTVDLTAPHLNSRIQKHSPLRPTLSAREGNISGARNSLLFNLGILLLEIAYSSSWKTLQQSHRPGKEQGGPHTEFQQARRLAMSGSSGMGSDYDRIVEQLIECDFGCGADLSKKRLQAAVHRDVVCPLETLERGLEKLHLGT